MFTEADIRARDAANPFARFHDRFYRRDGQVYLDGNSLGLLSKDAEAAVLQALDQWKTLGIDGWLKADPAWFTMGEDLGALTAPLVGADPRSVVVTGGTTINLHQVAGTIYTPTPGRRKIVATSLDFPSDIYALQSLIAARGGDPANDLVRVASRDGRTVSEGDLVAAMTDKVAMVLLPSVLYRSGQLLDMAGLTAAAHERGIVIGFDCAHSVGSIPHRLDEWGVDFAVWCNYKYLNSGPGSIGGLYVNARHHGKTPALAGWWGYDKDRQFDMVHGWEGAPGAGAWQISTPSLLSAAPVFGSLRMYAELGADGIGQVREASLGLTTAFMELIEESGLTAPAYGYRIGTPRETAIRGGHVAVEHDAAPRIARALKERGVIPDFRQPDVIRLAPIPWYNSYQDLWDTMGHLKAIIELEEHRKGPSGREKVA